MKNNLHKIAKFHKVYGEKILNKRLTNKNIFLHDPKEALFFIFSFSFYQGRRDELSRRYEEIARKCCKIYFSENKEIFYVHVDRVVTKDELKRKYSLFFTCLSEQGLKKEGDILMVISLLNFIQSSEEKNIVRFIIKRIKSGALTKIYNEIDSIWSIGPKISSLILRDIVYIYQLENYLQKKEDYYYLQPIDTWVHKIAKELTLINHDRKGIYKQEAKNIVDICFKRGVNPIHFNQGAWYLGSNSLNILLNTLNLK